MANTHNHIPDELLARYFAKTATQNEISEIEQWLQKSPENVKELEVLELIWQKSASNHFQVDTDAAWKRVHASMSVKQAAPTNPLQQETSVRPLPVERKFASSRWIAAAVVVLTVGFGWFLLKRQTSQSQALVVTTAEQTRDVELPDGTKVFLNYHSSISYPASFEGDLRAVTLTGEAFFDVKRDPSHPFVIDANGTAVRVLGTSFNVRAYKKEMVRVDVKTGKVSVSKDHKKIELVKGESVIVRDDNLTGIHADPNMMGYKTQVFDFAAADLADVIQTLKDGYHADIRLTSTKLEKCRLTISFKKESLDTILSVIAETLNLKLKKEGKVYWLEGNGCE